MVSRDRAQSSLVAGTNGVLSVLLAPVCAACRAVLEAPLDGCVCKDCWNTIPHLANPMIETNGAITKYAAAGEYAGSLTTIIHAFKYDHRRSLALPLAALMSVRAGEILEGADCLVPIPLHPTRLRARGFNQARELARHLKAPTVEALARTRHTPSQVDLPADRRHANVRGAFQMRSGWFRRAATVDGLRVVLIDDVCTTGATLEACALTLREAGAEEVRAFTAARVSVTR